MDTNNYYRPKRNVTACSTPSAISCSVLEADNCEHCHAAYGHYGHCPLINRATAEARSAVNKLGEEDMIRFHAHFPGIAWEGDNR